MSRLTPEQYAFIRRIFKDHGRQQAEYTLIDLGVAAAERQKLLSEFESALAEPASVMQPAAVPPDRESTASEIADAVVQDAKPTEPVRSRFEEIARRCIARGENRVLPIAIGAKNPAIKWAGSDLDVMTTGQWADRCESWVADLATRFPELNACVVAKPEENLFVDCDTYKEFVAEYEAFSGEKFPITYTTSARENRVQIHFQQTDASRKLGNVGQFKSGDIDLSVRQRNLYVLAEGSQHPTGSTYQRVGDCTAIIPMPDKMGAYIHHLMAGAARKEGTNGAADAVANPTFKQRVEYPRDANGKIPAGYRHNATLQRLGDMHYNREYEGDVEGRYQALIAWREENVVNPRSKAQDEKIRKMVESSMKWAPSTILELTMKPEPEEQARAVMQQQTAAIDVSKWRDAFRSIGQMEQGDPLMLIDGVLPEGITFLGALPGHGKTLFALSMVRALTTGKPFLGNPLWAVKEKRNVIYLIPETSDKPFRRRCESFQIPDGELFLARTVSAGATLPLTHPWLLEAVRQLKPVVFLDTAIRFSKSADENSAAANKQLVDDIIALRAAGAIAVVLPHHSKKDSTNEEMSLENMLRGTGDFGAMCETAYGIRRDSALYNGGCGPLEFDVKNLKPRELDYSPAQIRVAATYRKEDCISPVSHINESGDLVAVDLKETAARVLQNLLQVVANSPDSTVKELAEEVRMPEYLVKRELKRHGWHRIRGGAGGSSPWHKDDDKPCPYDTPKGGRRSNTVSLDAPSPRAPKREPKGTEKEKPEAA